MPRVVFFVTVTLSLIRTHSAVFHYGILFTSLSKFRELGPPRLIVNFTVGVALHTSNSMLVSCHLGVKLHFDLLDHPKEERTQHTPEVLLRMMPLA
jgi:hypothetical protein